MAQDASAIQIKSPFGVKMESVTACAREMAILIDAGVPLLRAIRVLAKRSSDPYLREAMDDVADRVERGSTLAAALAAHPKIFDELFVNIVKMGETGGSLDVALQRLAAHYEREQELRLRVRNALIYPIAALLTAIVVICIIVIFVVPQFTEFYEAEGVELPWPTQFVMGMGTVLVNGWWAIILALVLGYFAFNQYKRTPTGRRQVDYIKLWFPKINGIYIRVLTTRLSTTMTTLIQNGIPLIPALRMAGDATGNVHVAAICNNAAERIELGDSLTNAFEDAKLFPPLFLDMVGVGEEAGSLDVALERVSVVYEQQTRLALDGIVTMIQPVMVVFLGLAVILLAVAVLLPYFELQSVILA